MHSRVVALLGAVVSACLAFVVGLSSQAAPAFEVVSIRRADPSVPATGPAAGSRFDQRPDGAVTATNVLVSLLIGRAYPLLPTADMPEWAQRERYDVRTTSSVSSATPEDRLAMLRSMLADRFKLSVRVEPREQQAYILTLARSDGSLGPGLSRVNTPCPDNPLASNAPSAPGPPPQPDLKAPPPACTFRIVGALIRDRQGDGKGASGDLLEGEATMSSLALVLRIATGRLVVDKTGLSGTYRVAMNFDSVGARVGPALAPSQGTGFPSVFIAVEQQLGLKLESSRVPVDTLVIERLERPTEN